MRRNDEGKETQIIGLRIPLPLLARLDKLTREGERNFFINKIIEEYVDAQDPELTQAENERVRKEHIYTNLKKDYADSVTISNKLLTNLESRCNLDELNNLAYELGCPRDSDSFGRILLGRASPQTVRKMYAYKLDGADSLFVEDWQLYLQLLDERQKQAKLMVELNAVRCDLQDDRVAKSDPVDSRARLVEKLEKAMKVVVK
jgi:hypothetical protein